RTVEASEVGYLITVAVIAADHRMLARRGEVVQDDVVSWRPADPDGPFKTVNASPLSESDWQGGDLCSVRRCHFDHRPIDWTRQADAQTNIELDRANSLSVNERSIATRILKNPAVDAARNARVTTRHTLIFDRNCRVDISANRQLAWAI